MDDVFQVRILTSQQLLTNNITIMVKKEWSKWDEKRCIEVIKVMNQYPDNLTVGFEECAKKFGGTPRLYRMARYNNKYRLYKFRKNANSLVCASLSITSLNYKNSKRVNGEFKPERAERVISTTANFFKGWVSSCTKILQ